MTTGPWRVVYSAPEQKVLDRADTWWGVEAGVAELPAMRRFVYLPDPGEQGLVSGIIANQYDIDTGIQPTSFATVFAGNDEGHHLDRPGVAVWQHRLVAALAVSQQRRSHPWSDPKVRWAISYYLDRQQIIDVAWLGASSPVDPVRARLSAAQAVPGGGPAADRRVPLPGVQPREGRRAPDRKGLDQRRQRHVAG